MKIKKKPRGSEDTAPLGFCYCMEILEDALQTGTSLYALDPTLFSMNDTIPSPPHQSSFCQAGAQEGPLSIQGKELRRGIGWDPDGVVLPYCTDALKGAGRFSVVTSKGVVKAAVVRIAKRSTNGGDGGVTLFQKLCRPFHFQFQNQLCIRKIQTVFHHAADLPGTVVKSLHHILQRSLGVVLLNIAEDA